MQTTKKNYTPITPNQVPDGLRFDVPRRNQGQIVEVAYGGPMSQRSEHDEGAPYKRVTDASEPPSSPDRVRYYRLDVAGVAGGAS